MWPSVSLILEKIHFFLPRIPKVIIQLFKDNHSHLVRREYNDEDENTNLANFEVLLKSSYTGTAS